MLGKLEVRSYEIIGRNKSGDEVVEKDKIYIKCEF